ncbi:MGH1-like glycoside hydrolase domain-containing protein [Niabella beijingensis]|uniref:MGH1-like glycoside hydrolase domain-containing protein n=1 Tax=Niabella beijingensis TaxID=2872700 RepID=UPI001CBFF416|nr:glycosyl hydrolase family 65 protein [Niabella beijingensis]MBZ4188051.1 glycoside hydrolase [Niabella beijingensis]
MRIKIFNGIFFLLMAAAAAQAQVLQPAAFKHYVDHFNAMEQEPVIQAIPNTDSWNWMQQNIPLFECPDKKLEEIYYFRWWTLRKHIKQTPQGFAFTEFLIQRSYADKYNLISSALGHHIYESRWLHDQRYLDEDVLTWYRGNDGKPLKKLRFYSSWNTDALYNRYLVNGDAAFIKKMFPDLRADYEAWEAEKRYPGGLFWQYDVRDAMEETISGGRKEKNPRPSINGYMYGNAKALSGIAALTGDNVARQLYEAKADTLKQLVQRELWNDKAQFFEVRKQPADTLANVMEEIGFIPWYFNLPDAQYSRAWSRLMDVAHFNAPAGITTADRSHPGFRTHGCCKCEWDGAVWPFATAQTLTAMANLLNHYQQKVVSKKDYYQQLRKYALSQYANGQPYIGEYMDEKTGKWLTADERGRYYNHSTFNDLVITGLAGLRPRADNRIEVNPLLPAGEWDWFALDNVLYHGKIITIIWDKTGKKYDKGKGLSVWADGKLVQRTKRLTKITGIL